MKNRRGCLIACLAVSGVFVLILAVGALVIFGRMRSIERQRQLASPPSVQVHNPTAGQAFPVGSEVFVRATVVGSSAIRLVELWMDGKVAGAVANEASRAGPFLAEFNITITDSGHILSVRAIDDEALIGQSIPIPIYGEARIADEALDSLVLLQEGESLDDIATKADRDIDALIEANPGLGTGALPGGTSVMVPGIGGGAEAPPAGSQTAPPEIPGITIPDLSLPETPPLAIISQARLPFTGWVSIGLLRPPMAPSDLQGTVKDCKVVLQWNDQSANEEHFRIWMAGLGVPARILATVQSSAHTGPVWFQFNTPPAGIYSFWVEAVNVIGSQTSEIIWMGIPATQCEDYTAAYLEMKFESLVVTGGYGLVYCYISVEGAPEKRFPGDDSEFITIADGASTGFFNDFVSSLAGQTKIVYDRSRAFVIPLPEDGVLDLRGECWGWLGESLDRLGEFSQQINLQGTWDPLQKIEGANFKVNFLIQPVGSMEAQGMYTFSDPTIPVPYNLREEKAGTSGNPYIPAPRLLKWNWDGDEEDITGFTVFLNGNPFKVALPHEREVYIELPHVCGEHLRWEVAAIAKVGESVHSESLEYDLEPCRVMVEVEYLDIESYWTYDGSWPTFNPGADNPCDTLQVAYTIFATGDVSAPKVRDFYKDSNVSFSFRCYAKYTFEQMGRGWDTDTLRVPIDPDDPALRFGITIWDRDDDWDDTILRYGKDIVMQDVSDWIGYDEIFTATSVGEPAPCVVRIRVRGYGEFRQ